MPAYLYLLLFAGSTLWFIPFLIARVKTKDRLQLDIRARWGIGLQCVAYSLLWQGSFWEHSPEWWRVAVSISFFVLACLVSWTAASALGKHLRLDAALSPTQELIRSGPYRLVRHPIYSSMLCVLLATGLLVSPLYLLLPALLVFFAGAEIRMRVEDKLLAMRFGERFSAYQREVPRLIPFFR